MPDDDQGSISHASAGGATGEHAAADPYDLLVGPATAGEFNTAHLPLISVACFFIDDVRFAFDSSFVDSDCSGGSAIPEDIRKELQAVDKLVKAHPACPISLFGHADPVGSDVYNKSLSERRARAVYSLLIFQTEPDLAVSYWQSIAAAENWGADQRGKMQTLTGLPAGTADATLIRQYLQTLSASGPKLSKTDFLAQGAGPDRKGDFQGCSEFNPLLIFSQKKQAAFDQAKQNNDAAGIADRNSQNAPNRRVLGLLFQKGSKIDVSKWPCPRASEGIAGCIKRFWSDGNTRRNTQLPDDDRKFEDKLDTFACRFYQRLAGKSPCDRIKDPTCWSADYSKEIVITSSYGRYCHKYKPDGTEYTTAELPVLKFRGKIYVPAKTGTKITVEVRFKVEAQTGVTDADVTDAKTKLENGLSTYWTGHGYTLEATDPKCGKKSFQVEYKVVWVTSGENYVLKVYTTYPREGEGNGTVSVQKSTSAWTFAHEFGHCVGLPDEYSTKGTNDSVKYIKPDGTLDVAISAPPFKPTTDPSASIMSSYNDTVMLPRHCWQIAIEVQALLTAELGRKITCTIS